jgi:glycosyltransferase involved in cell wall biosynthesis
MRVALVTNILTPYRVPVFRALADTPGWQLRILVSADSEFDRSWVVDAGELDVERVPGVSWVRRGATRHLPLGLFAALRRFTPDVVVSGELGARTLLTWLYCALRGVRLVVWSYPTRFGEPRPGGLRGALARFLLKRARCVIGMGQEARQALGDRGVAAERIFDAPNACNHEDCLKALAALDRETTDRALRAGLGCRARVALFVGRLIPSKGLDRLIDAWDRVPSSVRDDWTLLFVGSGPVEPELYRAQGVHRRGEIVHVPALQSREVIELYAAADFVVLPSLEEPWGLVVNEAFVCGVPVLCSSRAGCAADMLRPGENGWVFDPADPDNFASALQEALTCGRREQLGAEARRTAERFRPEIMAEGMRRAIRCADLPPR